jgi:elongation factor 1-beta
MAPKPTPKTVVTLDIKPWDADTDMAALQAAVVAISAEGLVWGSSTLVDIGYGIQKLQQTLVIEDKVSLDDIQAELEELEEFVQSTDVVAMQKL